MPTVIIYWSPGRSAQQKKAVIEQMTDVLVNNAGARPEDVLIIFQEILPGDFGRGGQVILPLDNFKEEIETRENHVEEKREENHG